MIKNLAFILFIILIAAIINFGAVSCTQHQVAATPPGSPPAPLQPDVSDQQLSKIIDAVIGTTDFTNWMTIFSSIDTSIFPISATLFVPDDSALFSTPLPNVDPFTFAYHIVPQCLAFSELRLFEAGSRLPTLIPDKYILITSNSDANFTLDNSRLTRPDLFSTNSIIIHGISSILDYKVYGDITDSKSESGNPKTDSAVQMTKNTTSTLLPPQEEQPSCATCLCGKIKAFLVLALFCLNRSSWIQDLRLTFM